jgi:hypothetical protein
MKIQRRVRRFSRRACTAVGSLLMLLTCEIGLSAPRVFPTGVTIYDPSRAYNCYVSFTAADGNTYVIDMDGNEVHRWAHAGLPGNIIDPALIGGKRGHVLLQLEGLDDPRGGIFTNRTVGELDWNGNAVWQWGSEAPSGGARQNHDWTRLANGNTLLLVTIPHPVPGLGPKVIGDQAIYEVNPTGTIVWKWIAGDHLSEFGFSPEGMRYLRERVRRNPPEPYGYLEINQMRPLGPNHWFDAGDKRFNPENIMIDSRKGNVILIIDKRSGKVVWRLGPYFPGSEYSPDQRILRKDLPRSVDQLSGQHNAQLIAKGLPGAGNLLVFDDEGGAGFPPAALGIYAGSRLLEIDPIKRQIVWEYTGENSGRQVWSFFSSFVSSAQRLPNGNTLVDEGMDGRFFQITPSGDIVWEYVSPYFGHGKANGKPMLNTLVYRAQAVPYQWVPDGTPHQEKPVVEVDNVHFHVPEPETARTR